MCSTRVTYVGSQDTEQLRAVGRRSPEAESRHLIAIASTFTADLIQKPLKFWMETLDISCEIAMAPYAQVMQELLNQESLLSTNKNGFNVLLIRVEDWIRDRREENPQKNLDHLRAVAIDFTSSVEILRVRTNAPTLVFFCPSASSLPVALGSSIEEIQINLAARLGAVPHVHTWSHADLVRLYSVAEYEDIRGDRIGHIPYTNEYYAAIATLLARQIVAHVMPRHKVIAVDCDNTLWKGICGEDGPAGIELTPAHIQFQEALVRQHDAGILLCLCSKNSASDVDAVFRTYPEMPLRGEHIICSRVNWDRKSANIRSLAEELNLSLDSFILIDDSPVECAEVRAHCPAVLTLEFPEAQKDIEHFLKHTWAFDNVGVTDEAKRRTESYKENVARTKALEETADLEQFLATLELNVEVSPMNVGQLTRVAELIQRTNQFNLTTIRRSISNIEELWTSGAMKILVVRIRDRFGDYGVVGVVFFRYESSSLDIDTFVLSCRVLGRGAEHRIVNELGKIARYHGLSYVTLRCRPTARNAPAQDFLNGSFGNYKTSPEDSAGCAAEYIFRVPTEYAAGLAANFVAPAGVTREHQATPVTITPTSARSNRWHEAAYRLSRISDLVQEIDSSTQPALGRSGEYLAPRTPAEAAIAKIWAEVLGVQQIGVRDDFFESGGDSLLAVQAIGKMGDTLNFEISLFEFLQESTVEKIAWRLATTSNDQSLNESDYSTKDVCKWGRPRSGQEVSMEVPLQPRSLGCDIPLTGLQRRFWKYIKENARTSQRLCCIPMRVLGPLDVGILRRSLEAMVLRHESLRTRIVEIGEIPRQVVDPAREYQLEFVDLSRMSPKSGDMEVARVAEEFVKEKVDLSVGPLFAAKLIRLSDREHVLILTLEHMISDGVSQTILPREMWALYQRAAQGKRFSLPEVPLQFGDYAVWQQRAYSARAEELERYWSERLRGAPRIEIPRDGGLLESDNPVVAILEVQLASALTARLNDLARQEGTLLTFVFVAIYVIVMSRWCGQRDVVLEFVSHARYCRELQNTIGLLVNFLHLRVNVNEEDSFLTLLRRVSREYRSACEHQDFDRVPVLMPECTTELHFNWLPKNLNWLSADTSWTPLSGGFQGESEDAIRVQRFPLRVTWPFNFIPFFSDTQAGVNMLVAYRPDRFAPSTIERFCNRVRLLAEEFARRPRARLMSIDWNEFQ